MVRCKLFFCKNELGKIISVLLTRLAYPNSIRLSVNVTMNSVTCNVTKPSAKTGTVTKMAYVFVTWVTKVTIVKFKYQSATNRHAVKTEVMVAIAFFLAIIFVTVAMDGWEKIANIRKIG